MSQKKGKASAHIQPKTFNHPQTDSDWVAIFEKVDDPREILCNTRHSVTTILFITFTTILCGATNCEEIHFYSLGVFYENPIYCSATV